MKNNQQGKTLRHYLPNVLLAFLLSFCVFGLTLIILFFNILLKPETYTEQMYKSKVDEIAYNEICEYFDRQYNYTGVAPETLKKSTDKNDVAAAIYAYVDSTFDYISGRTSKLPEFEYDFTSLEENLHKDYEDWALENKTELDEKTKKIEEKTLENIESYVSSKLDIMMFSQLNKENGISTKIRNNLGIVKNIGLCLGLATAVLLGLIFLVNRRHRKYCFYWIFAGCFCSSMMMMIPSAILKFKKYFDGLVVENESMYKAFVNALYSVNDRILITGAIILGISAVLLLLFIAASKNMFKFKYRK